jgi:hypothetical protein
MWRRALPIPRLAAQGLCHDILAMEQTLSPGFAGEI